MTVKLRYVELEPDKIFNWLNPENVTCWVNCPNLQNIWWEPDTIKLREEFGKIWMEEFDNITGHFSKLEESILKDGVLHPINTITGHPREMRMDALANINRVPKQYHSDIDKLIYTQTFGGSRLTIAQKHNIKVPIIAHDYSNLFEDCTEVTNANFKTWFGDNYMYTGTVPYIRLRLHTHITDSKYSGMNGNTRNAQKEATEITKRKLNV